MVDPLRSGVGFSRRRISPRSRWSLLWRLAPNAFAMVSPVYALETSVANLLHINHEAPVLALILLSS